MKVALDSGEIVDLGITETNPTIGIIDYSRRVTDDFGVTTVVPRGFARRMSVRLGVPFGSVDALQRRLATLRATSARWIADPRFASLTVTGFYKDFSLDIATAPLSYCTLTVEGLAETDPPVDTGGDPAIGQASTLRLLQPVTITGPELVASSVPEADAPTWSAATSYPQGARVQRAGAHRIYESAIAANLGNDPIGTGGTWIDIGPTNRWAMLDQALGTATEAAGSISVTIDGEAINAVALLDLVNVATVRIQATNLDRTIRVVAGATSATILDLPGRLTRVTVTITGSGAIAVGTLLVGKVVGLGVTEAAPTAGITDYSRKDVDDFGDVTIVERAWAKRMEAKALIRTDAIDLVAGRIAAVRAVPSLWIGRDGMESLTVYGFFKDFSIEVGETSSKLSLSIEGLSAAAKISPIGGGGGSTAWPDITDPDGTKPSNNADKTSENTSKDTAAVGGKPAGQVLGDIASVASRANTLETVTIPAVNKAVAEAGDRITAARDAANAAQHRADGAWDEIASEIDRVETRIDAISQSGGYDDTQVKASIEEVRKTGVGNKDAIASLTTELHTSVGDLDTKYDAAIKSTAKTAADDTQAVSQRLDQLIAEGGGGSDGVDTVARSEVQRVEKAYIKADEALAESVRQVSASIGPAIEAKATDLTRAFTDGDTALATRASNLEASASFASASAVPNDNFNLWADGQPLPAKWGFWTAQGNFRTERLTPGRGGGRFCVRTLNDVANVDSGFVQVIYTAGRGKWVVEVTIDKVNGSLSGAGVTLSGEWNLDFCSDPDTNGKVGDSADGEIRSWSKMFDLDARDQINVHAMHGWSGFGRTIYAKALTWHCLRLRPATDGEIKAGKADAALNNPGGVLARIKSSEDTLADLPNRYGAASKVATLEAQVNFAADSGLQRTVNARIEDRATAIADAKAGAVAQTLSILRGEYDGTVSEVRDQRGVINGLNGKAAAYVKILADAGNGVASLSLWSDQYGGAWELAGNGRIRGNLVLDGTLTGAKIAPDAISGFAFFNSNGGSVTFSTTAAKTIASIGYAGNGGNSSVTVSGVVTLGPQAPAGTRLSMYISLSGSIILGPIPISAQRGSPVPFSFTTSTSFTGSRTIELTVQATGASGSGDPHIVDSPTIILTEFKKLGA